MKFYYPVVIKKISDDLYTARFPDLEMCEAKGDSLEDVLDRATEAAWDWIDLELHEIDPQMPSAADPQDIKLEEGEFVRNILVNYKMMPGWEE